MNTKEMPMGMKMMLKAAGIDENMMSQFGNIGETVTKATQGVVARMDEIAKVQKVLLENQQLIMLHLGISPAQNITIINQERNGTHG